MTGGRDSRDSQDSTSTSASGLPPKSNSKAKGKFEPFHTRNNLYYHPEGSDSKSAANTKDKENSKGKDQGKEENGLQMEITGSGIVILSYIVPNSHL